MAAMAIPPGLVGRAAEEFWISPKQQLTRMMVEPIAAEVADTALPVHAVALIVAEYAVHGHMSTNWYTALDEFKILPGKMSPLPEDILVTLGAICPVHGHKRKEDGTYPIVRDTHSLYYDPTETLPELAAHANAYGQEHLAEYGGENPFQFTNFCELARQEHDETQSASSGWILCLNDVLDGSRNQSYEKQAQMVAELSARAGVRYKVPSLKEAVAFAFFNKAATRKSVLKADQILYTYTRVQEMTRNCHVYSHVSVGAFSSKGLYVGHSFNHEIIGMLALRNL